MSLALGDESALARSGMADNDRHLSEYTHLEAELVFITFKDLLDHLEDMVSFNPLSARDHC